MDAFYQHAYKLISSQKAREAFDLSKEDDKIKEEYGKTQAGQRMLLARRLVEGGIRMITPTVPKSLNSFPVIFEAAPDALLGSSLQAFTIRATGEKAPGDLTAPLSDTVHHIEINNEGTYHSHTANRIPTAVTEAVPFSIELESPAVPIVKNGKMVTHLTGQGGILRIDPAPKGELAKPAAKPAAKMKPKPEVADTKAPAKPLSRLEQLRQKK